MVSPGDEIELFDYATLSKDNDVVYLMDEDKQFVATLSKKDNDIWKFLFDHTSEVFFKCFSDCKPTFGDLGCVPLLLGNLLFRLHGCKNPKSVLGWSDCREVHFAWLHL